LSGRRTRKDQSNWEDLISKPIYSEVVTERDVLIPMRDGVRLASDVHRPKSDEKFPALLAFQPWGKEHEAMENRFPPQRRPHPLWDGSLEGGDTRYLVSRGYVHIVVDARGTGTSEGELAGIMGVAGSGEGKDIYDVVEWIAAQPWCDGNVGMIGISYLASVQVIAAAQQPPHLKAIFPEGGHYEGYRHLYHGGILWLMPRAAMEGRGGDSGIMHNDPRSFVSYMKKTLPREEFERRIQERLMDPDIANYPNYHQLLKYPDAFPIWLDFLLNPLDGEFYWGEYKPEERFPRVKIPAHFGVQLGRGWQMDETIEAYQNVQGPKWLVIRPGPPMQERPFHEFHDEIVRWYDYWLKGIDTGIREEPPVKEWRYASEWPLPETKWTKFFLRTGHRLLTEPEPFECEVVPPDGFYQPPLTVTHLVYKLAYTTPPFTEDVEVIGSAALHIHAMIDTDDTNWMVTVSDIDPDGKKSPLTTGWLKASHRELDEKKSKPWAPYHPHTRTVPVPPGEIIEYPIRIYPFSNVFCKGHCIEVEIKSLEAASDVNVMLPPESGHLNSARATTHKIFRDIEHQSYLLLPVIQQA
jgi:predicted acyl esterase